MTGALFWDLHLAITSRVLGTVLLLKWQHAFLKLMQFYTTLRKKLVNSNQYHQEFSTFLLTWETLVSISHGDILLDCSSLCDFCGHFSSLNPTLEQISHSLVGCKICKIKQLQTIMVNQWTLFIIQHKI